MGTTCAYADGALLKYNTLWRSGMHHAYVFFKVTHTETNGTVMGTRVTATRKCERRDDNSSCERWDIGLPRGAVRRLPHPKRWTRVSQQEVEDGYVQEVVWDAIVITAGQAPVREGRNWSPASTRFELPDGWVQLSQRNGYLYQPTGTRVSSRRGLIEHEELMQHKSLASTRSQLPDGWVQLSHRNGYLHQPTGTRVSSRRGVMEHQELMQRQMATSRHEH